MSQALLSTRHERAATARRWKLLRLHFPGGIAVRISVLSWLVTIITLLIFVTAIIPEQKRDLQEALFSKARGISFSLQDSMASAAISEDYSSVVDQCLQVLAGDDAIEYLVITRHDGVAVVVGRSGWRTDTLDESWRPSRLEATGGIQYVPLFGRRVFHFSRPFDEMGLHWGWIHVGLSLGAYDRSVQRIYERTALLTMACIALSLLASIIYARLQVRPIASLQAVVQSVSEGNLTARAAVHSGDEIESLALAFNGMADSILQRNEILESVRLAAQRFLSAPDWRAVMPEVLAKLGTAAHATHVSVHLANGEVNAAGELFPAYDWMNAQLAPSCAARGRKCALWKASDLAVPLERVRKGEIERMSYSDTRIRRSSALVPIQVGEDWFGFLNFDDCRTSREWGTALLDSFRASADMMGAAIARQRAQEALVEANEKLESRVVERTAQLQDQVAAKEAARAELAEAQQRLIALSRLCGMAEVATGVLHNVGNVLNSVNVSATLASGLASELRVDNLVATLAMIEQHRGDLAEFLDRDPKGQRVLPYLMKLGGHFQEERKSLISELEQVRDHVSHIKQIVNTQQSYAKVSGLIENVSLADLVEDAFRLVQPGFDRHHIRIEREYEELPPVPTDKHQVLQILTNLLRNAKQAIKDNNPGDRFIRVAIRRHGADRVRIEVRDSGVGLSRENLTRIFAHGFTTKKDGHGFGLHSGALAVQQMGGSLVAESEGEGRGATFILDLPLKGKSPRHRSVA
jgi:signal transduction histidine kinase